MKDRKGLQERKVRFPRLHQPKENNSERFDDSFNIEPILVEKEEESQLARFIIEIMKLKSGSRPLVDGRMTKICLSDSDPKIESLTLLCGQESGLRQKYVSILETNEAQQTTRLSMGIYPLDLSFAYHRDKLADSEILTNSQGRIITESEAAFVNTAIKNILGHLRQADLLVEAG